MSNSTSTVPQPLSLTSSPSINKTYGALLIGTFVSLLLYGWALNQCYRYFRVYQGDRWILKGLITAIIILETFNIVLNTHLCYYYLVSSSVDPSHHPEGTVWSFDLLGISTIAVAFVCEIFYLRRVYLISQKFQLLVIVSGILIVAELAIAVVSTTLSFIHSNQLRKSNGWMNSAGVGAAILADTLLAAALILTLHRSRTGVKQTDSLIDRLILYTVNTGLLIGIFNILSLILAVALPNNLIYVAIDLITTVLYANSVLAVLNARGSSLILPSGRVIDSDAIDLSVIQPDRRRSTAQVALPTNPKSIEIIVAKESFSGRDSEYDGNPEESGLAV